MIRPELLRRLCDARDLLRDWEDEPLSVIAVARASGLTRFHFIRLFKAVFGETPLQYRSRAQIEKAKQLLVLTDFVDHRGLHGSRFLQPGQLQRTFFAPGWHVALGISAPLPANIGKATAVARQLGPWLPFAYGGDFGDGAILEKTTRQQGY